MKWSRRDLIKAAGTLSAAQAVGVLGPIGCSVGRPQPALLQSRVGAPPRFEAKLPTLSVLKPVLQDSDTDYYDLRVREGTANILPGLKTRIWGYDGSFPGPTVEARRGRRIVLKLHNDLPVPIVNHLHGGHTPAESDGYPTDLILPADQSPRGQWPAMSMQDARASVARGVRDYIYPNNQRAATLWYHDHRMDFTGPQMWRGLAGMYIVRDEEEGSLPLPRGEREIALFLCDRSFDSDGSFLYPSLDSSLERTRGVTHPYMGGVLGDVNLVNGAPWPRLEVSNTRYRFRVLNASNARRYELDLHPAPSAAPSFLQIGSDGGLLSTPLAQRTIPIAPAERFDLIIDFSRYPIGSKIILRNRLGKDQSGEIMRFDVTRREADDSVIPCKLSQTAESDQKNAAMTRAFDFRYGGMTDGWVINGKPFNPMRMDARVKLGSTEIWRITTDIHHPIHLHLVQFKVLDHSGHPRAFDAGWKDTIDLSAGETANILVKFTDYCGRYVFHCHNLEHEDMAMMANFEVI